MFRIRAMEKAPIDLAIDAVGTLTGLAARMDVDLQVIVNWRKRGIPPKRVLDVERATIPRGEDGKTIPGAAPLVSRHQLAADLYPIEEAA